MIDVKLPAIPSSLAAAPWRIFALLLVAGWLLGCAQQPITLLPTRVPAVNTPVIPPAIPPAREPLDLPATFTPEVGLLVAGIVTRERTPTPLPTATPQPSPTPVAVQIVYAPSSAPYRDEPLTATPCTGQGVVYRSRFPSQIDGPWRDYHIYLPPCYGQDGRAYPVIYLIHGSIQSDTHWLNLGLAAHADAGIASGRLAPFIAVMPFNGQLGNITSGGAKSIEAITVDYLLPYIDSAYCTWAAGQGRSIGGISRGGYWALEIAFRHPGLFAAVAGHSSHLRLETDPARYNPLVTYAEADLSNLRIWMDRGETDFLRPGQDQLHNNLLAAGIAHDYWVNPGGHSDNYWAGHIGQYIDWHVAAWPRERTAYPLCG